MIANKYYNGNTRDICHGIKESDPYCMDKMIDFVLNNMCVRAGDILIPAPQHQGYAIYTKYISEAIARETGAIVKDIIKSDPRQMLYENRNAALGFYKTEDVSMKGKIYLVDNVISTGRTCREISHLLGLKLEPIVYGIV